MSEPDLDAGPIDPPAGEELAPPAELSKPPQAKRQVKLIEIIWALNDEAERIENAQNAFVIAGLQQEPNPQMLDRAHVLRSGATLVGELEHSWTDIRPLMVERRRKRGRK